VGDRSTVATFEDAWWAFILTRLRGDLDKYPTFEAFLAEHGDALIAEEDD
jgi:hypothetical protein